MSTTYSEQTVPATRGRSAIYGLLLILLLAGVFVWGYYSTRPTPATVTVRDIVGLVPLSGDSIVPPSARADVMPPFRAPVEKVQTSIGKRVERGDVLVQLSFPAATAATDQTKEALRESERAYANAKAQADRAVADARRQRDTSRSTQRSQQTPPPQTSDQNGQPTTAPAPSTGVTPDAIAAEDAYNQAIANRDSALAPLQSHLDVVRDAYQQARSGAKMSLVRAPISGTVLALNVQPGKEVGVDAKTPIATIIDLSKVKVQARMAPDQVGFAKPETEAVLRFKDIPNQEFKGTVERVTSSVASMLGGLRTEQQYVALIRLDNKDDMVKPGMKADVGIKTGEVKNATAVPSGAIGKDNTGRPVVSVLRNGKWLPVVVEVGLSDAQYTQIKTGVTPGEVVQVTPKLVKIATAASR